MRFAVDDNVFIDAPIRRVMRLEYIGPDRAEEVSAIAYRIFFEVYPYEKRETLLGFLDETQAPDRIREQMSAGMRYAFVLTDEGERAGYVGYGMDGDRMFLSKLYLFDSFRGHGLGTAVMDLVEREAVEKGAISIYLDVNGRNTGAMELYRRKGYIEKGRVGLNYIRVVMEKPLGPDVGV